jgi:hypothetical protein
MNMPRNSILSIFLIVSVPSICEDEKTKNIVVHYANEAFSNQDLIEIKKVLNPICALQEGNFKRAFTLIFATTIQDVLSSSSSKKSMGS